MEAETARLSNIVDVLREHVNAIVDALPELFGAVLVVIVGWILARAVRRATRGFGDGLNRLLIRFFPSGRFAGVRVSSRLSTVVGAIGFWSVVLLALTLAAQVAGLDTISNWLDRATVYLPNLIVASVILLVGYLVSLYVGENLARQAGSRPGAVARLAQGGVMIVAFVMALDQVGIDVAVLITVTAIAATAITLTLGLSAALGARRYASNLVGIRSVRDQLAPGQRLRIDDITGHVLEITRSQVTLETEEGKALVPGHFLSEHVTHILSTQGNTGNDDE